MMVVCDRDVCVFLFPSGFYVEGGDGGFDWLWSCRFFPDRSILAFLWWKENRMTQDCAYVGDEEVEW